MRRLGAVVRVWAAVIALVAGARAAEQGREASAEGRGASQLYLVPGGQTGQAEEGENCSWACSKWSRRCEVDVRGVRRCQTVCERLEKQCQ